MYDLSTVETKLDSSLAWFQRGQLLTQLGFPEVALDCFDYAIEIKEDFFEAWREKGYILGKLDRFEEAALCFERSLSILKTACKQKVKDRNGEVQGR
ncbi:MAG: tetratricopeptide repeat protein [Bacteroidota bacterium]